MPLNVDKARFNMIEQQVRPWDVADSTVLGLLNDVPREAFTLKPYQSVARRLGLRLVPISPVEGESMLPQGTGRIAQDVAVKPTDTVLHIGTGSGFMAALLGKQAKSVLSLESTLHWPLWPKPTCNRRHHQCRCALRRCHRPRLQGL